MSFTNRDLLNVGAGLVIGVASTVSAYRIVKYLKRRKRRSKPMISNNTDSVPVSTTDYPSVRRSVSRDDAPPRRFHRLLSTTGPSSAIDTSSITVDDGQNVDTQTMMNLLYCMGENQARKQGYVHRGITCNICSQSPLCGIRYKCANCPDYDVCDRCESKDDHNSTHTFLRIQTPLPPLTSPRTCLAKTLYPGKQNNFTYLSTDDLLEYMRVTNFDQYEIEALHEEYRSLAKSERGISREVFDYCLGPLALESNLLLERLFKFYDADGDRYISFEEMIKGLSVLCKGTIKDKMPYAFDGYDLENKRSVSKDNMRRVFKAYYEITIELVRDAVEACEEEMMANFDDSSGRPVSSLFSAPIPAGDSTVNNNLLKPPIPGNPGGREGLYPVMEAMSQDATKEMVDSIFKMSNLGDDERMSYDEFVKAATLDNSLVAWFDALGTVF